MPLPNYFYKFATYSLRKLRKVVGASTIGVRAIVINQSQHILLIRQTYSPGWYLPGGGVENHETPKAAILRELKEEVGVSVIGKPELLGIYYNQALELNDYPILYVVKNYQMAAANSPEVAQIAWFDYSHLPVDVTPATKRRLDEYFLQKLPDDFW